MYTWQSLGDCIYREDRRKKERDFPNTGSNPVVYTKSEEYMRVLVI